MSPEGGPAVASAQHQGCPEERELVEQPGGQEGAQQLGAALHHHAPQPPPTHLSERPPHRDASGPAGGDDHDDAAGFEAAAAPRVGAQADRPHRRAPRRSGQAAVRGHAKARVEHDAVERTLDAGLRQQQRVVGEHGPDPHRYGVVAAPHPARLSSLVRAGDPLRVAGACRDPAVEGQGHLQEDEGTALARRHQEGLVEEQGVALHDPRGDRHPRSPEEREPSSGHRRVRVAHRRDHAAQPGGGQPRRARRRAPLVSAGLEVHVERCSARSLPRPLEGQHLRVGASRASVPRFSDHAVVLDDDAAHHRVGVGLAAAALGEVEGAGHPEGVVRRREVRHRRALRRRRRRRRAAGPPAPPPPPRIGWERPARAPPPRPRRPWRFRRAW